MSDLDFTELPKAVARTLDKAGAPLTEKQFNLMAGSLALYQLKIEMHGLPALIEILQKSND